MAINMERIEKLPLIQKALIVLGVIIIMYVLFYFLYVSKKMVEIEKKQSELTQLQYEVSQGKAVLADIDKYEAKKKELEKELKEAEKRLPKDAKIEELLEKLSDLARGNGISIPKFHPGKTESACGGICKELNIEVEFSGTYSNLATFLDQVSKLERIVGVKSMKMTPKGKGKSAAVAKEGEAVVTQDITTSTTMVTYMFTGDIMQPVATDKKAKGKGKDKGKPAAAADDGKKPEAEGGK